MSKTVLLFVIGTRSDTLLSWPVLRALSQHAPEDLPFRLVVLSTGQEDTELTQAFDSLEIEPDVELDLKAPHAADAALAATLLTGMEAALRHHKPGAVVIAGASVTAWATAVACYYKHIPVIHLGAGDQAPPETRPFPEWFNAGDITRLTDLALCPDPESAERIAQQVGNLEMVGRTEDETLDRARSNPPEMPDPTVADLPAEKETVLVFLRRREHHANALRPLCEAVATLAEEYPDHIFLVVHSLQAHICDALDALLPKRANVRGISPMPHPAFVRELARSRLVVTDSAGLGREAVLLGRPIVILGDYSFTTPLVNLALQNENRLRKEPMQREKIEEAVRAELAADGPGDAPEAIETTQAGQAAASHIIAWCQENMKDGQAMA